MSALRTPTTRILATVALVVAGIGGACTINPQPLPPEGFSNSPGAGSSGGGSDHTGADATTSDASPAPPTTVPDGGENKGDSASDGGEDGGDRIDGGGDGSSEDAPEDG